MGDTLTVLRKELIELVSDRQSLRGVAIQSGIFILVMGVLMPSTQPHAWLAASPMTALYFFFLPGVLAATVSSDAFAGERERRTLETLLATPLSDGALLAGKALAALAVAGAASLVAEVAAVVTVNVTVRPPAPFLPPAEMALTQVGAGVATAAVMTAIAIGVSLRTSVARAAQQMSSLGSMALGGLGVYTWSRLGLPFTWRALLVADAALIAAGVLLLLAAARLFRRDRFFEQR